MGPGLGAMTHMVLPLCGRYTVFEIDRGFIRFLQEHFGGNGAFTIIEGDVVKRWKDIYRREDPPDLIFGNLPYNCAATLIGDILEAGLSAPGCEGPRRMVFTVQREVAQRMAATTGETAYGAFSMLCALSWKVRIAGLMKPGAFYPAPEVTSALVIMEPLTEKEEPLPARAMPVGTALIHDLFLARRKRIRNSISRGKLAEIVGKEALLDLLQRAGIDPDGRGEQVDANSVKKAIHGLTDEFGFNILL